MIRSLATLCLVLLVSLSGCSSPAPPNDDSNSANSHTSGELSATEGKLTLTVQAVTPTQNVSVFLQGTVNQPAKITVLGDWHGTRQAGTAPMTVTAGNWTLEVDLEFGRTNLTVIADSALLSVRSELVATRFASATFEAYFTAAVPARGTIRDLVWYDPDELASAPKYNGTVATRAPEANVHDLLVTWERQSAKKIDYSAPSSFGFGVERIDGVGQPLSASAPPYWCYKVNQKSPELGISGQALAPGDVITWDYSGCT